MKEKQITLDSREIYLLQAACRAQQNELYEMTFAATQEQTSKTFRDMREEYRRLELKLYQA